MHDPDDHLAPAGPLATAVPAAPRPPPRPDLDQLLEPVPDAVLLVLDDGRIDYASPAGRQLFGLDAPVLTRRTLESLVHPDDVAVLREQLHGRSCARPGAGDRSRTSGGLPVRLRHSSGTWHEAVLTVAGDGIASPGTRSVCLRTREPRRSTLDALRQRLDLEDLLSRTASTFIHRPSHEVAAAIGDTLADIGRFAAADRAFLYLVADRSQQCDVAHEWVAPGVERARSTDRYIPVAELTRWFAALEHEEAVYIPRVADLDGEWEAERRRLDRYGCRSVLAVPLTDEGRTIGFVGFDLVHSDRLWSDDQIVVLSSTAGIIAQALGRSDAEQRFGLAFDHAPLGMALHSPDGDHIQVNPAYCRLMGRTEDELLGTSVLDLVEPDDVPLLQAARPGLLRGEQVVLELRLRRADGALVWGRVHIGGVRATDGTLRYCVSHVEDVTERARRDAELRASERRYRTLVENLPSLIIRYDRALQPVFVSPSAAGLVRATDDAGPGRPGVAGHERWHEFVRDVFRTGCRGEAELEVGTGARTRWYQARAVPEPDEEGAVAQVLVVASEITALKHSEAELAHQALHDPLTGLANRALLVDVLDRALSRRRTGVSGPALLFIDLDRFKWVNDSLGHRAGDDLLVVVARRLRSVVRPDDLIARLGGDEFVIVIEGIDDPREPARVAERLKHELSIPVVIDGTEVVTSASIGIAMAPRAGTADADSLLRDADAAMYLAKANGRDRFEIFDAELRSQAREKLHTESALRRAIDEGGLEVHYQPELDLTTGSVVGFEALVRWRHPGEGLLEAASFIDLAEETGLIVELGDWVLREACRQAGRWPAPDPEAGAAAARPPVMRVNLSGRQLAQPDLVDRVAAALAGAGIGGGRLCLEVTERALMADPGRVLGVLGELRALGVELAVDDFGTGLSSLAHLKRIPVDVLKMDRSFVQGLGDDPDDTAIASAIISLARSLDLRVVAEGVETGRQVEELRRLGCDRVQGYYFARPAPVALWPVPAPAAPV